MCSNCNLKQSKNREFNVLKEEVFKLLSIKELAKLIYIRNYKLNIKQLCNY